MRFTKLLKEYENTLIVKNYAKSTIKANKRILNRFWKYLNGCNIYSFNDVSLELMNRYKDFLLAADKFCHSYIYSQFTVVRSFFRFLYSRKYIDSNELTKYPLIRPKKELIRDLPLESELHELLSDNISIQDLAIIELYYATGMRLTELINLNISDIDFDNSIIFIKEGKGKRDRFVPVTDHALGLIKDHLKTNRSKLESNSEPLFLSSTGRRIDDNYVGRVFRKLQDKHAKKITPHTLRHCFATHMLKNGANVRDIQEILGHDSIGTTQKYTKVEISDLKRVIKRFHPRENEIYSDEEIVLPGEFFFSRKKGCTRQRRKAD